MLQFLLSFLSSFRWRLRRFLKFIHLSRNKVSKDSGTRILRRGGIKIWRNVSNFSTMWYWHDDSQYPSIWKYDTIDKLWNERNRHIGSRVSNHPDSIRSLSIEIRSICLRFLFRWSVLSGKVYPVTHEWEGEWKLVHAWNTLDRGRDRWVAWQGKGEIWGKWLADILSNACTPLPPLSFQKLSPL